MINRQFIVRKTWPTLTVLLPFAIVAGQLGLDICRWWIAYGTAAGAAVLMGVGTIAIIRATGPGLTVDYSWVLFWLSLAALTAVQGYFYAKFRHQCPVLGPIIPVDMLLEWLVAPIVLGMVTAAAFRHRRTAARQTHA
ncbi:hypothetical protein FZI91_03995 [Mycobacterium sp. CBMA271]|uniref:hypothetical protein n=1 Tax=unclassified Mycobacteroides TaxID=2618759 RepID=UPI00132BCA06|nr:MULTISPECIES: hypothetical protein [unclassified Mycobacteroides]MUM18281.1 hypothetical protein [Mycobacteroides sp. CBMA 326]MUM20868.1 hypothetical protein [Mycobacteroides sp. CBMA 271]